MKHIIITIITLILFITSCKKNNHKVFKYPEENKMDTSFYFPSEFKKDTNYLDYLGYYTEYLKSIHEENLSIKSLDTETYRLIYNRSFHVPLIVRINKNSIIIKKDFNGIVDRSYYNLMKLPQEEYNYARAFDEYESNLNQGDKKSADSILRKYPLIKDTVYINYLNNKSYVKRLVTHKQITIKKTISRKDYNSLIRKINKSKFWQMKNMNTLVGIDGSTWILEANTKEGYYFVYHWGPPQEFIDLCKEFLKFTDLEEKEIY